ncbi:hypothetical protein Tco_0859608 [Tanacetum coccineum]|uniref:Uncharacterized protein n=1 Tax=Tanacetum coccineum TaxID=301880 RepID=A0ABQ5BD62_9ASTR
MPILNELITDDIRGANYYNAYLKKVAKHHRYLAGEEVSDPDSPAPKPAKSTKPKITKQTKTVAPKAATKKPQPSPTKPKEKKRKQDKETTEAKPPAKRTKAGKMAKKRTLKRSQQLVDEVVDEGIPLTEPGFGDLEADTQRAIEESLKDAHGAHRGPLPPVVFREPDTGKYQPLPEVEGKGKEKVAPTEPSGHDESSSVYAELGLTESDTESDEEVPPVVKSGAPDEGQVGPNPAIQDEGQAGPNPGNDTVSQTLSTPGIHAGPNLEHTDAEATDATSQPQLGQVDEEFTATAYPNIQENLKLTVDDLVIPEEPASSTRTLSSLQHLAKDFSFGDQFFNDKPSEANNEKTTADTEAESMVSVTIHQDTSIIPPMTSPVINLVSVPDSPTMHRTLPTTTTATATTTTNIYDKPETPSETCQKLDMKRNSSQTDVGIQILPSSMRSHDDVVYEALEKSIARDNRDQLLSDLAEARKKKKKRQGSHKTPPGSPHPPLPPLPPPAGPPGTSGTSGASGSSQSQPPHPPPSNNQGGQSTSTTAPSSSKMAASAEYAAWTMTDTRLKPSASPISEELHMMMIRPQTNKHTHLVVKTLDVIIFPL